MSTYDNLNIATTTLVFQGSGNTSVASGIFDLSSLAFLPNIPLIDQIEVERVFDTGYDTKFGAYSFTIADRRQMFIFPKDWYTINEQTKVLTFKDLSTIPLNPANNLYYPYSRTYTLVNTQTIDIPTVQATSSVVNGITRQADIVYIRRKTPSINSIVTFAPGTRLTTTQLNLQFDQLKYNIQELVAKFRNEAILKYDENAVDGPFLGQGDLKMNNNYIKDVNSPAFTQVGTDIADPVSGLNFTANTFLVNLGTVATGIINGTLHRTGLNSTPPVFSGDYNAGGLKLINLANGSEAQDAATMGQVTNASNLSTGSISQTVLASGSIPLGKLVSTTAGQGFTLPADALPNANSLTGTLSFGSSTATNTNNMVYLTADVKGRITAINHRNLHVDDLPTSGVNGVATIYGASGKVPQITVDTKGRITVAADRTLGAGDISSVNASAVSGTLAAGNLPSGVVTPAVISIPNSITVDTYGRVTAVSGGSITASNVSDFNTAVRNNRLDQMAAPTASVSLNSQTITNLGTPVNATDAATRGYVDTDFTKTSGLNAVIDNRLQTNSVYLSASGILNAVSKRIINVTDPIDPQDVVTKKYFTDNSITLSNNVFNFSNKYASNLIMKATADLSDNDVVNFGLVRAMALYGQTITEPQTFTNAWASAGTAVSGNKPYVYSLSTLAASTGEMLVVTDSQNRTYVPTTTVPTAAGQFFLLNTGVSPKTVTVYLDSAITPTGTLTIRNFGLSRSVAATTAGASTLGQVMVPTAGGLLVDIPGNLTLNAATSSQLGGIKIGTGLSIASGTNIVSVTSVAGNATLGQVMVAAVGTSGLSLDLGTGALSLPTASTTQLGGVKIDTTAGLTNTSGSISVTRSDSTTSNSTTTLANSKAVSDLRTSSMLLDGTQTMTGKLKTFASTASVASLNVPIGSAVTSRASGDIWNVSGNLQYSPDGTAVKTLAYLDSSITGNAATATALTPGGAITLTGAVTSSATTFTGSAISIATALASSAAVTSLSSSTMTVSSATGAVTLTLPQAIGTTDSVTFNKVTLGNIRISNTANQIDTSTGNLKLDSASGTTEINDTVSIAGPLTVTGTNATTLGGAVTLNSTLAFSTAPCKIALGGTAGAALTSINSAGDATGVNQIGDIILRTPASGKAFLVRNATNTTVTAANDVIITEGELASRIAGLSSTYMPVTGGNAGANSQTFGSALGNFTVTGFAGATNFQIDGSGNATFAKQLTISQGGLSVNSGGIGVVGGATIAGGLTITSTAGTTNGVVIAAQAPSQGSHLTNRDYVDGAINSISDANANIVLKKLLMQVPIREYVIGSITITDSTTPAVITTSGMTNGVPKYFPIWHGSGGFRATNLTVLEGHQVIILEQRLTSGTTTFYYTESALEQGSVLPISTMLSYRVNQNTMTTTGTFPRTSIGSILTGGVGGTIYQLNGGGGAIIDYILMRIA